MLPLIRHSRQVKKCLKTHKCLKKWSKMSWTVRDIPSNLCSWIALTVKKHLITFRSSTNKLVSTTIRRIVTTSNSKMPAILAVAPSNTATAHHKNHLRTPPNLTWFEEVISFKSSVTLQKKVTTLLNHRMSWIRRSTQAWYKSKPSLKCLKPRDIRSEVQTTQLFPTTIITWGATVQITTSSKTNEQTNGRCLKKMLK